MRRDYMHDDKGRLREGWLAPHELVALPDGYELREDRDAAYLYAPDGRLVLKERPGLATPELIQAAALEDLAGRRPE